MFRSGASTDFLASGNETGRGGKKIRKNFGSQLHPCIFASAVAGSLPFGIKRAALNPFSSGSGHIYEVFP
jgi:hypothetical protein